MPHCGRMIRPRPVDLYLVQHGAALTKDEDPARPLSEVGRFEVTAVARRATELRLRLGEIRHSGKLRAQQTAEILARHVSSETPPTVLRGLDPNDDPAALVPTLEASDAPMTLVGHLPHLSRLASLLLCDEPERGIIAFRNGAIVQLVRSDDAWQLRSVLTPELAGA